MAESRARARYLLRGLACIAVVAGGAVAAVSHLVAHGEAPPPLAQTDADPARVVVIPVAAGVYVGQPPTPGSTTVARHDPDALVGAVHAWRAAHPDAIVAEVRPLHADDGTLLGHLLVLEPNP